MASARSPYDQWNRICRLWWRFKTVTFYRLVFGSLGRRCEIHPPMLLNRPERMHLGDQVTIRHGARLEVVLTNPTRNPRLEIGSNVNLEQHLHIVVQNRVRIADNVSVSAFTMITDVDHPYAKAIGEGRIGDQYSDDGAEVTIGEGTFIGIGCSILPGVAIGRRCIIGTRTVVNRSVPDYCVAVGVPARIVKRYDNDGHHWRRTMPDGAFAD